MFFIAKSAIVEEDVVISEGSYIWHFSHLMSGVRVGINCTIGERVYIGKGVLIGDNVKVCNGANIYEGTIIKNNVFIGNNVSFSNVKYPRAWRKANEFLPIIVEDNATIDANSVISRGVKIGRFSTVGRGAIVINDVPEGGFVVGPAAQCICERETCVECAKRKEKNLTKHLKYVSKRK